MSCCKLTDISVGRIQLNEPEHGLFFAYRIGIISKSLPGWLRTKMLSLDMVMVPITLHKWAAMPEYMKMTEIFNSITIRIQIYKNKVKTLPRDGHRIK